jgi:PAS domain S-box-containing protein
VSERRPPLLVDPRPSERRPALLVDPRPSERRPPLPGDARLGERRATIAVVEDEPIVATDLSEMLGELGYDCCGVARSCAEALELAAARSPDLVLMDIHIEGAADGIETARLLRERHRIPVVFLTAFSDDETLRRARDGDPLGYVVKPVNPRELRAAIEVGLVRKRAEDQLRARERWLDTKLRAIGDAVVAVNPEGRVRTLNPKAEALTGWSQAHAEGRPIEDVMAFVDERSRRPVANPARAALDEGRTVELPPHAALSTAQRLVPVEGGGSVIVDGDERLGAVLVFRDVSGRRELERRVEHADRLASLGMLAAGVAHEINNPLTFVSGNASFVRRALAEALAASAARSTPPSPGSSAPPGPSGSAPPGPGGSAPPGSGGSAPPGSGGSAPPGSGGSTPPGSGGSAPPSLLEQPGELEELVRALDDVLAGGDRIRRIVADLRTFARADAGEIGAVDVTECVRWALRLLGPSVRERAQLIEDLPALPAVLGNDLRLGQVFLNLLQNAVHALGPGDPARHRVGVQARLEPPERVRVEIWDTGAGIAPELLPNLFTPFFTTKEPGQGTGLGLAVSHGIVSGFGGEIRVESVPGVRTTFSVVLPVAPPARVSPAPPAMLVSPTPSPRPEPSPLPTSGRIAVVDDEPIASEAARRLLSPPLMVETFNDPRHALEVLSREPFDAIVCDILMPGLNGIELYRRLCELRPELAERFVFVTAAAFTKVVRDFRATARARWLDKPYSAKALRAAVADVLAEVPPPSSEAPSARPPPTDF